MTEIRIDFSRNDGVVKPMHAINNGPVGSGRSKRGNAILFREAGIPFMRNHDAAFCTSYGGEFTVDVHRIFPDFSLSERDPASYHFEATDRYVKSCMETGGEVFYRLGATIEHGVKKGTYPPKNFEKWAVICEHIIRHYTEGWADGFCYPIRYWEIWNEPDCQNADGSNPCWQGTWEEFEEFFITALRHLKGAFPHLKIGGPAFVSLAEKRFSYIAPFLKRIRKEGLSLDFFSFHRYAKEPSAMREYGLRAKKLMEEAGIFDAELILDEWNYVRGWTGDDFDESVRTIKGMKGAAFTASCMCVAQDSPLDMIMYYEGRPCAWCGLFDTDFFTPLKGYYPFVMFGRLYRMGRYVKPVYQEAPLYAIAASSEEAAGAMLCYYREEDGAKNEKASLILSGLSGKKTLTVSVLNEESDLATERVIPLTGDELTLEMELPLYTCYYLQAE